MYNLSRSLEGWLKTRHSLVSNSSSSNFIVIFPCKPTLPSEVLDYMFNGRDGQINSCYDENFYMTHKQIAEIVCRDCQDKNRVTLKDLTEEYSDLICRELYEYEKEMKERSNSKDIDIDMMMHFEPENIPLVSEIGKIIQDIEILKQEEDVARQSLMIKHGIIPGTGFTGEESEKFKKKDEELRKSYWKKQKPKNERRYEIINEMAKKRAQQFLDDHKDWWPVLLSYEDHTQEGSFMEHQNVFRHIEHIQISHH